MSAKSDRTWTTPLDLHHFTLRRANALAATATWAAPKHKNHWPRQESIYWNRDQPVMEDLQYLQDTYWPVFICGPQHMTAAHCGWALPAAVKERQNGASIERNLSKLDCWATWRRRQARGVEKPSLSGCRVKGERKKNPTQLHLPGHLKTSSSSAPAHYMAAWKHVVVCQAADRGCSSKATAELPWASGGKLSKTCVYVRVWA